MNGYGPERSGIRRHREHRDLATEQSIRDLLPDRRRSTTMHAAVYEALITQRLREAQSQARQARLARALSASRRAERATRVAERATRVAVRATERAVAVPPRVG
jgi:hypothetical protein